MEAAHSARVARPPGVDAVIFDWGGTLTPWHTVDLTQAWATVSADPAVIAALRAAESEVWRRSRDEHRSGTLQEVLDTAGHAPDEVMLNAYHAWWDEHTYTDPQTLPMMRALRQRQIKIGILSNTLWSRARHEAIFARDGVSEFIDGAVYSSEIPWSKPHPEAFRAAMAAVGVDDPARAVYVGDRLFDDIYGAQNAGMRAVHVPHSDIPVEQIGATIGEPDAVIHELAELVDIVDRWRTVDRSRTVDRRHSADRWQPAEPQ